MIGKGQVGLLLQDCDGSAQYILGNHKNILDFLKFIHIFCA